MSAALPLQADASSAALASYYERHMALRGGVAHGWLGRDAPRAHAQRRDAGGGQQERDSSRCCPTAA